MLRPITSTQTAVPLRTCHMCVWSILPMGQREKRSTAFTTDLISLPQATARRNGKSQ